jgi:predicted RNA polymerase sigma factor
MFLHLTRAELLLSRKRFAEARAAYQRVLELAPFNLVARERLKAIP